jgi:hypothetical protein
MKTKEVLQLFKCFVTSEGVLNNLLNPIYSTS